jgi:hypothetical protein
LLHSHQPMSEHRLHPMTFVSCGSTRLWSGRSPRIWERMRLRGLLKPNAATLHALAWVAWGTASPRTLRLFLRGLLHVRNVLARPLLKGVGSVEWQPREAPPPVHELPSGGDVLPIRKARRG